MTQDSDQNSHCWFSLQESILIPRGYKNILLTIDDAQIPISFYSINKNNNTIIISINGSLTNIVIPDGNYDADSLGSLLESSINLIDSNFQVAIVYNPNLNKFLFTPTTIYNSVTIRFPVYSYIVWGFSNATTSYSLNSALISPAHVDLAGSRFLFVQTPTFGTYNINSKTGTTNQIMCKIPVTRDFLEIEQYRNITNFANKISIHALHISVIEVVILDEYLQPVDFNGAHWSMTMSLVILGESPEDIKTSEYTNITDVKNTERDPK